MSFIDTHGGLIAVACVIGFFALVGWWSDRRKWKRMMRENATVEARREVPPNPSDG